MSGPTNSRAALLEGIASAARRWRGEAVLAPDGLGEDTRIAILQQRFSLNPFEMDLMLMAAAVALDPRIAVALGEEGGLTPALALARIEGGSWDAFAPDAALQRWSLLNWSSAGTWLHAPLSIDPWLCDWLAGLSDSCSGAARGAKPLTTPDMLPASWEDIAQGIASRLRGARDAPVILLRGVDRMGRLMVARRAALALGLSPWIVNAGDIPPGGEKQRALARLWERETLLCGALPVIDLPGSGAGQDIAFAPAEGFAEQFEPPLVLTGGSADLTRPVALFELPALSYAARQSLWARALEVPEEMEGIARLAYQFSLDPADLLHAAAEARSLAEGAGRVDAAWTEARVRARRDLGGNVTRIMPELGLDDLVLPPAQRASLDALEDQVVHQATVYGRWGMEGASGRGLGITALFSGPSGAGKTTAAEALAGALGLDLLHVDLSQVVSKYIGETSKNLDKVFAGAEAGGSVLLFDEADAIFGKRSEVRDSHDRYANMEVSYLLQRMERYRGLAILTTNQKGGLDDAFLRRIRYIIHFPFPDRQLRAELWRRALPEGQLVDAPDWDELGRLSVAGGSIRNIALNAAFLAAAEGGKIGSAHLLRAIATESAKTEQMPMHLQLAKGQA
jgi:hypothetical protein